MVRGLRTDASLISLKERRAAYRANTAIWGLQIRTAYNLNICNINDQLPLSGFVGVGGCVELRKLRMGGPEHAFMARLATAQHHGPSVACSEIDILTEFSTRPLPPVKLSEVEPGLVQATFDNDRIGLAGQLTYFVRDIIRNTVVTHHSCSNATILRTPIENLVIDLLSPVGTTDPSTATVEMYSNLLNRAHLCLEVDRMAITEEVLHLGDDLHLLSTPLVPRCAELVTHVLKDAGWDQTRFDIYRCVVQYPILSTSVQIRVDADGK